MAGNVNPDMESLFILKGVIGFPEALMVSPKVHSSAYFQLFAIVCINLAAYLKQRNPLGTEARK